jgi:hypothetical protein
MEVWIWVALAVVAFAVIATLSLVSFIVFLFSVLNEGDDAKDWFRDDR